MRFAIRTLAAVLACGLLTYAARANTPSDTAASAVIERFLSSPDGELTSYRAFRTLEAASRGRRMHARLTAWTSLDAVEGFQYSIVDESGSGVVRGKVLRAAL